jgi:hypothetical protein
MGQWADTSIQLAQRVIKTRARVNSEIQHLTHKNLKTSFKSRHRSRLKF